MLEVGLLLGGGEALALLGLGLLFRVVPVAPLLKSLALGDLLGDTDRLGLLVGLGLGVGLGFGLGGLPFLLALDLGVFGGVPRV